MGGEKYGKGKEHNSKHTPSSVKHGSIMSSTVNFEGLYSPLRFSQILQN